MRTILTLLNTMAFCALCLFGMIKTGIAEEIIKKAATSVVKEVVQDELKDRFKDQLPSTDSNSWWKR